MRFIITLLLFLAQSIAIADDIASCSGPSGKAYYPEYGLVGSENSGWQDDKISNGITKLVKISGSEKFDILFVDARNEIKSAIEDGAAVIKLNQAKDVVSVIVVYPGKTAEVYTFLKNSKGKLEYIHVLSRAGDDVLITKSSLMRGDCEYIKFGNL